MEIDLKNLNYGSYEVDCYLAVNCKVVREKRFMGNVGHISRIVKNSSGRIDIYTVSDPINVVFVEDNERLFTELSEAEIYSEFLNSPD